MNHHWLWFAALSVLMGNLQTSLGEEKLPRRNVIADCVIDDIEYSSVSPLPVRIDLRNAGKEPVQLPPVVDWMFSRRIRVFFRRSRSDDPWQEFLSSEQLQCLQFKHERDVIGVQGTQSFYEVFPLWQLQPSLLAASQPELEFYVNVFLEDGVMARSSVKTLRVKRVSPRSELTLRPHIERALPYLRRVAGSGYAVPPELSDVLALRDIGLLAKWVHIVSSVDHLCQTKQKGELPAEKVPVAKMQLEKIQLEKMSIAKLLQEWKGLPPIAREAMGLRIASLVAGFVRHQKPDTNVSRRAVIAETTSIALEALAASSSDCQAVLGARSELNDVANKWQVSVVRQSEDASHEPSPTNTGFKRRSPPSSAAAR